MIAPPPFIHIVRKDINIILYYKILILFLFISSYIINYFHYPAIKTSKQNSIKNHCFIYLLFTKDEHTQAEKYVFSIKSHIMQYFSQKSLEFKIKDIPLQPQTRNNGAIAQLVEHRTENPCVPGSIPGGTTFTKRKIMKTAEIQLFQRFFLYVLPAKICNLVQ